MVNINFILGSLFGMVAVVGGPVAAPWVQGHFDKQLQAKAVYVSDPHGPEGAKTLEISAIDRQESAQRWQRYQQGVQYCGYYALALIGLGLVGSGGRFQLIGGAGFAVGTLLYAGGLALGALLDMPTLQLAAPIGAMILIIGWGSLLLSAVQRSRATGTEV
ncbi:hypothetical protein Pan97_41480 [Bremerella volcania]|uniref:Uncharacterized protein n=1 Tax=Bremerella volcania TaxID=2527984 RepID=A0A518CCX9_9BACT|nr:DUF423 domain-containing protein [Bremerella volcania]QDU77087.1 hypothetical protein Pan97_41480 [Bremerella volcania]